MDWINIKNKKPYEGQEIFVCKKIIENDGSEYYVYWHTKYWKEYESTWDDNHWWQECVPPCECVPPVE